MSFYSYKIFPASSQKRILYFQRFYLPPHKGFLKKRLPKGCQTSAVDHTNAYKKWYV